MLNTIAVLILLLASTSAIAQTPALIVPGQTVTSLTQATATGAGTAFKIQSVTGANPTQRFTWTVVMSGAPASDNVNFEGSNDLLTRTDGVATATSATFTSATGNFTVADIGKEITINGAGAAGATLVTSISAVGSTTSITLNVAASTSVAIATFRTARWYTLDSSTTTTNEMRHVVNKPVLFVRANFSALSGGASPTCTATIMSGGQ